MRDIGGEIRESKKKIHQAGAKKAKPASKPGPRFRKSPGGRRLQKLSVRKRNDEE